VDTVDLLYTVMIVDGGKLMKSTDRGFPGT